MAILSEMWIVHITMYPNLCLFIYLLKYIRINIHIIIPSPPRIHRRRIMEYQLFLEIRVPITASLYLGLFLWIGITLPNTQIFVHQRNEKAKD